MGLVESYGKLFKREYNLRPVWPPTTPIVPGDYGYVEDGVFQKMGNITEDFGIPCPLEKKQANFEIHSKSSATKVTTFDAAGKAKALTRNMSGQGEIRIEFKKENSFYTQAANLKSVSLKSINKVSHQLKEKTSAREWNHIKWMIVSDCYEAPSAVLLGSSQKETTVSIKGDVKALIKVMNGEVSTGVSYGSTSNADLKVLGKAGPVLLNLFRVKFTGTAVLNC